MNRPHDDFAAWERLAGEILRRRTGMFPGMDWQGRVMRALARESVLPACDDRDGDPRGVLLPVAASAMLLCAVSALSIQDSIARLMATTTLGYWTSLISGGQGYPF